jgi:hypothetical protein
VASEWKELARNVLISTGWNVNPNAKNNAANGETQRHFSRDKFAADI